MESENKGEILESQYIQRLLKILEDDSEINKLLPTKTFENLSNNEIVEVLIKALPNIDETTLNLVTVILNSLREISIPALIESLKSDDWELRYKAVLLLGEVQDTKAIEPLINEFGDEVLEIGSHAANSLRKYGEEALKPLIKALDNEDWAICCNAINVVGYLKNSIAIPALIPKLKHTDTTVRELTCLALGDIGDKSAFTHLIQSLQDEEETVYLCAIIALGKIRDSGAIEPLLSYLEKEKNAEIRKHIVLAIKNILIKPPAWNTNSLLSIY